MGLTGVIYAAIVVAWATFLIPLALRRHDQTARNRSIERFSSTMRVLSTNGRKVGSRVVLTPKRGSSRVEPAAASPPAGADRPSGATRVAAGSGRSAQRPSAKAAAARRRGVLRVLVALTMLTGVLSLLGVFVVWAVVVPLAIIVGFLVLARRQVRRANDAYWEQAKTTRPSASNVVRRSAARVDASHGVVRPAAGSTAVEAPATDGSDDNESDADEVGDPADDEPTITLTAAQLASGATAAAQAAALEQERSVAVSLSTADGGSLWDPLPITLPTYVGQAVAKRSVRNISLGEAGTWSSGHSTGASAVAAEAGAAHGRQPSAQHDGAEVDQAEETQRAANA